MAKTQPFFLTIFSKLGMVVAESYPHALCNMAYGCITSFTKSVPLSQHWLIFSLKCLILNLTHSFNICREVIFTSFHHYFSKFLSVQRVKVELFSGLWI